MEVTQEMLDIVNTEATRQRNENLDENDPIFLDPDSCRGMTQEEIDATREMLDSMY